MDAWAGPWKTWAAKDWRNVESHDTDEPDDSTRRGLGQAARPTAPIGRARSSTSCRAPAKPVALRAPGAASAGIPFATHNKEDRSLDTEYTLARFNMIAQQIRPWNVIDERALSAMEEIPREQFVPDAYRGLAYADCEILLGDSASMREPKLVARMLQALAVQPGDKALVVGAGLGYEVACFARLAERVVGMERDPVLAQQARERLARLGLYSADIRTGDGLTAFVQGAPFDVIAVTGGVPNAAALDSLEAQLAQGGRLFCVVGEGPAMEAQRIVRVGHSDFRRESLFETSVPPLVERREPEPFVF